MSAGIGPILPTTPHFTWGEANCHCGCVMPDAVAIEVRRIAPFLERVRSGLGDRPMTIAAWYRCPSHNAEVGGAPNSQHIYGRAIDFSQKGKAPLQIQSEIKARLFPDPVRGLENDPGHTHIDFRPGPPVIFDP